ncbi:DUF1461 domain-containing protein [Candidatus Woesearchaeota archaeon]|nr:DUF1461 domain-containing protein [Candidatus Woesearchaeota archaeon]
MRFATISKILLVLILPVLLFLAVFTFVGFDESFYEEKFAEHKVNRSLPTPVLLNEKVINFVKGKSNELPGEFNEREKRHLEDVRNVVQTSTIILYSLISLFVVLLLASIFVLKINNLITNFMGKVLIFGGALTIVLAGLLYLMINLDFASTFESFHQLFFKQGSYLFDPSKEMLVRIYPEQLFMDLGARISKWAIFASVIVVALGLFLLFKSKRK